MLEHFGSIDKLFLLFSLHKKKDWFESFFVCLLVRILLLFFLFCVLLGFGFFQQKICHIIASSFKIVNPVLSSYPIH